MRRGRAIAMGAGLCAASVVIALAPATSSLGVSPTPAPTVAGASIPVTGISSAAQFAVALLQQGKWPVTGSNVCALMAWEAAEGGHFVQGASRFNPLNTTQSMPGDSIFNSVGVRNYPDWQTGLDATLKTLSLGFYDAIRASLTNGKDAQAVLSAVGASVWGTKFEGMSVSGECLSWASDFDRKRDDALARVTEADAAVASAQPKVIAATAAHAKVDAKFTKMSNEINAAKDELASFARSLYITGAEPEVISKLDAVQSGDPVGYEVLRSYPGLSATRDAGSISRAVGLLTEVGTVRQQASDELAAAADILARAQAKKAKADAALHAIESESLPT